MSSRCLSGVLTNNCENCVVVTTTKLHSVKHQETGLQAKQLIQYITMQQIKLWASLSFPLYFMQLHSLSLCQPGEGNSHTPTKGHVHAKYPSVAFSRWARYSFKKEQKSKQRTRATDQIMRIFLITGGYREIRYISSLYYYYY